jgi:hypothetical protein
MFILSVSCSSKKCKLASFSAFTHYQINQADEVIIGTDKLPRFNVYDNPNGKVIFNLPPDQESGWGINIVDENENYFKIYNIWRRESKSMYYWENDWMPKFEYVWIEKGSVGINTSNYDGEIIEIHKKPNNKSKIVGYINAVQTVRVFDICGDWAFIEVVNKEGEKVTGWMSPKFQCANPLSTCP